MSRAGLLLLVVLGALWTALAPAVADPLDDGGGGGGGKLRLSPSQRQQLKEIRQRYRQSRMGIQTQIKARRMELLELLSEDPPDKGKVNAKLREIMEVQTQLHQGIVDELFEVRSVLSPEQWRQLRSRLMDDAIGPPGDRGRP